MKKYIALGLGLALIVTALTLYKCSNNEEEVNSIEKADMVGGQCGYEEFTGSCRLDSISDTGNTFTFNGKVNDKEISLAGNMFSGTTDKKVGDTFVCSLGFITEGTCTPCTFTGDIFTLGECGEAAWSLFRSK